MSQGEAVTSSGESLAPSENAGGRVIDAVGDSLIARAVGDSLIAREDEHAVFAGLFRNNAVPMAIAAVSDRRFLDVNDAFVRSLGYARIEIIGKTGVEIGLYPHPEEVAAVAGQLDAIGRVRNLDGQLRCKDGRRLDVLISGEVITSRDQKYLLVVAIDVTERKQAERQQRLALEIMTLLSEPSGSADAIACILAAIKREYGFDAVGIRLQKGDDFPYAVQEGFPNDFLLAENSLLVREEHGSHCRNECGRFDLECTCGMVLSGRKNAPNTLLTESGSFWTNRSSSLLDLPAEDDPRINPRNRCSRLGYLSMAVIPVRAKQGVVGLLQLNDRRKDCFTPEMIRFFEGISASIGVALARKESTGRLIAREQELQGLFAVLPVGVSILDGQGQVKELNPALESILGITENGVRVGAYLQRTYLRPDGTPMPAKEFPSSIAVKRQEVVRAVPVGVVKEDGATVWTEVSAAPLGSPDTGCVLVTTDITLRTQAEAELEQFRASFENGVVPQGLTSTDGRFLRVNEAMAKMLGYTRAEIEGKPFNQFTHPDDRVAGTRTIEEMLSGRESARFEKRYIARNGVTVWVDVNVTAIRAADGMTKYFFGTYLDISERKRAGEELQESRKRLRLALDSAGMGVWSWDVVANRRYFEDQTCAMLGLDPANFRGTFEEFLGAVHPDDRDTLKAALARTLEQDAPYECEYTAIWPDGSKHSIATRGRLLRDGEGKPLRIDGILWDQTERVRASQALSESEERFRHLANVFPQTIFEVDLSGRFTYLNEGGLRMQGVTHADLEKGIQVLDFVAPEDRQRVMEHMRTCVETMGGGYMENRALRKDGTTFDSLVYAAPILSRGQIKGFRGVLLDISERKQAERLLQEANRLLKDATARANELAVQAELANKAKSTFLASMSHEIRTPMNGLTGITGLLLDSELTAEQRRLVETLRASSDSLVFLINDILDLSKIEAGKVILEVIDFDLGTLFSDLAALMAPRAAEKHIEFTCTLPPTVPARLRGAPGRLRQVLTNLIANAFKFTKEGMVDVTAAVEHESAHEAVLRFSVRDTGIGIASDKIGLLFNKFVQADESITRKFGGTGLGLAISKQLAELMGGTIGVHSQENRGSEFWFTARFGKQAPVEPAAESLPEVRPAGPAPRNIGRENVRILVAEDNLTNQMVAVGILKKLGLRCDVVADGRAAVEALRTTPYDLVLMDVEMPEMDGLEATRVVRAAGSEFFNHAVPIIAMTAHAMEGVRTTCLEAGMDDYVSKPIVPTTLSAVLDRWLAKPSDRGM